MTFEQSTDWPLIKSIVTHPRIWPWVTDDFSGPPEAWEPIANPNVAYVIARDGDEVLGLWFLHPHSKVCWEIHTCLLPTCGSRRALEAGRQMIAFVWANTPCRRLITNVPAFNRHAARFAEKAGMQQFGRNPRSFMRAGQLIDQVLYGVSPE